MSALCSRGILVSITIHLERLESQTSERLYTYSKKLRSAAKRDFNPHNTVNSMTNKHSSSLMNFLRF